LRLSDNRCDVASEGSARESWVHLGGSSASSTLGRVLSTSPWIVSSTRRKWPSWIVPFDPGRHRRRV